MTASELIMEISYHAYYSDIRDLPIPEGTTVLVYSGERIEGDCIYIVCREDLNEFLSTNPSTLPFFVTGNEAEVPDIPEGLSLAFFTTSPCALAVEVQKLLLSDARKRNKYPERESLFERLMNGGIIEGDASADLMQGLGLIPNRRFVLILVSLFTLSEAYFLEDAASGLSELLPGAKVFHYKGELAALCSLGKDALYPDFSEKAFETFLKKYGAFAAVSNSATRPSALRALYRQASSTIRFGTAMSSGGSARLFKYEDYMFSHIVELCCEYYSEKYRISSPVYFCHPALGRIIRYDRANGTDYYSIMRKYLENNCNMSLTARDLYMHRNTMLGKLEAIRGIIGVSLADHTVREQLMFSFYVLDYAEKVLHIYPF